VFMKARTDVALYVDQSPPGVDIMMGSRQHVYLPFFGGPDDRLALDFVVQICENPWITATIVRITKSEQPSTAPPKTMGEIETTNLLTVASGMSTNFPDTVYGHQSVQTRLQSDTADNLAWTKYNQQKREQILDPSSALSRTEFRDIRTPTPLRSALNEALKPSNLEPDGRGSPSMLQLPVQDGCNGKQKRADRRHALVVAGRSRRLAVEDHGKELKELMQEHGSVGSEVKKTIGDVGAAFVVAGCGIGLVVLQAAHCP